MGERVTRLQPLDRWNASSLVNSVQKGIRLGSHPEEVREKRPSHLFDSPRDYVDKRADRPNFTIATEIGGVQPKDRAGATVR